MTVPREDERLRDAFQELRADATKSGSVPDFDAMVARARAEAARRPAPGVVGEIPPGEMGRAAGYRRFMRAGAWASAALAATIAGLLLTERRPRNDDEFLRVVAAYVNDESGGAWRSPTDGLLDVPGVDLVRSVPQIGGAVRGLDSTTLPPPDATRSEERS